jgi:hypothetical protein
MLSILYKCDECFKILSEDGKGKPHISINFEKYSGWVKESNGVWTHYSKVIGLRQFCSGMCLGRFFNKLKITPKR